MTLKWSLGLLGGRPNHALWVIGAVESEAIHLDPHYCQIHAPDVKPLFFMGASLGMTRVAR